MKIGVRLLLGYFLIVAIAGYFVIRIFFAGSQTRSAARDRRHLSGYGDLTGAIRPAGYIAEQSGRRAIGASIFFP